MIKKIISSLIIIIGCIQANISYAQIDAYLKSVKEHTIQSKSLSEDRDYWVGLPRNYDTSKQYPVIYVLDAEWHFDLILAIVNDYSALKIIPQHIIIGVPNVEWEFKRGIDLTFSHTEIEYDGEIMDSTLYNSTN